MRMNCNDSILSRERILNGDIGVKMNFITPK